MGERLPVSRGIETLPVPEEFVDEYPPITNTVFGENIHIAETIFPDRVQYSGWRLRQFTYDRAGKDGCLFVLAPHAFTAVGIVGRSPQEDDLPQPPATFTERILRGSGTLLTQSPDGIVQRFDVTCDEPVLYQYGEGTIVAYMAGPKGLIGVNVGEPCGIPEVPLPYRDPQASEELWDHYDTFIDAHSE